MSTMYRLTSTTLTNTHKDICTNICFVVADPLPHHLQGKVRVTGKGNCTSTIVNDKDNENDNKNRSNSNSNSNIKDKNNCLLVLLRRLTVENISGSTTPSTSQAMNSRCTWSVYQAPNTTYSPLVTAVCVHPFDSQCENVLDIAERQSSVCVDKFRNPVRN